MSAAQSRAVIHPRDSMRYSVCLNLVKGKEIGFLGKTLYFSGFVAELL